MYPDYSHMWLCRLRPVGILDCNLRLPGCWSVLPLAIGTVQQCSPNTSKPNQSHARVCRRGCFALADLGDGVLSADERVVPRKGHHEQGITR